MTVLPRRTLLAVALFLGSISAAAANVHLKTAMPAPGSTMAAAPTELRFSFDGGMRSKPTGVTLTGSAGKVPLAAATLAPDDNRRWWCPSPAR